MCAREGREAIERVERDDVRVRGTLKRARRDMLSSLIGLLKVVFDVKAIVRRVL